MNNRTTGAKYENIAAGFLKYCGYDILERNYRIRSGEIDIIAKEGETICFVEVKYRSHEKQGYPGEAVTRNKQRTIIRVSEHYLMTHGLSDAPRRYDVVEILGDKIRVLRNCYGNDFY